MAFHHKTIKKFSIKGTILNDTVMPRIKDEYVKLLISQMRAGFFVPRVDISPDVTIKYDKRKKTFIIKITLYGVKVGKEKIKWIESIDEYRPIYTPQNKFNEFSLDAV
jgi:hypothetical protein